MGMDILDDGERIRYGRHLLLPEVGLAGQLKLKRAGVLLVGLGGLGSPVALYLAAAGVGRLGLVDSDAVDASNLQRQILYGTSDVARPKVEAARDRLRDLNPGVAVEIHAARFSAANALELVRAYDVIVDGADNFPTRYLVNDACVLAGKPNVHGAIHRFEGQVSVFWAARGACYRCLYPEPPPPDAAASCAEAGVLGVLPGIVGGIQAAETVKLILGAGDALVNRLLLFDALSMRFRELQIRKDASCPVCGERPTILAPVDHAAACDARAPVAAITPAELKRRLDAGEVLQLVDVREPRECAAARLPGALEIPLGEAAARRAELDPTRPVVVFCQAGVRSERAIRALRSSGYAGVLLNLTGGLRAWLRDGAGGKNACSKGETG